MSVGDKIRVVRNKILLEIPVGQWSTLCFRSFCVYKPTPVGESILLGCLQSMEKRF